MPDIADVMLLSAFHLWQAVQGANQEFWCAGETGKE